MLVKICGLRTLEAAQTAIDGGADLLGVIMVPNRKRSCSAERAAEISACAAAARHQAGKKSARQIVALLHEKKFDTHIEYFAAAKRLIRDNGPFLVGVFRNQSVEEVFQTARESKLDFIQLHGSEKLHDYTAHNADSEFGIIKRYVIPDHSEEMASVFPTLVQNSLSGFFLPLLDSEAGGEGNTIDWGLINELDGHFILAGGLKPENLAHTQPFLENVVGFDVSGGVEDGNGDKCSERIAAFIAEGRKLEKGV